MKASTTLAALALAASTGALAQFAPTTPVRISSVFPTGSGPDVVARSVAEKLQRRWSQPVIVEARPGGAGAVAINGMKNAPPTGHDLVVVDVGNMSINPLIFKKLSYDPNTDLVPVALLYKTAFFVAVSTNSPFKSFKDLAAAAGNKSNPLRYGSNAVGGPIHLGSARLAAAMGSEMMHVPYKETSQLYAAVATGEIDWAYGSVATAGGLARANKLRFLAVADGKRSAGMPDVPTLAEAGGPKGLDALTWVALMAPKGTPAPVLAKLRAAVGEILQDRENVQKMHKLGLEPGDTDGAALSKRISSDIARWRRVAKAANIQPQ